MIITKISGGIGNQMFQYALAKSLSKRKDDAFKMDISFYSKQVLRKFELNMFNIEENYATNKDINLYAGKENILFKLKRKLNLSLNRPISYFSEKKHSIFDENVFKYKNTIYLDGYWQNQKYFQNIKDDLIQDFTLRDSLSDSSKGYLRKIKESNSISMHIRRGDYVHDSHTNSVHGVCGLDYYENTARYCDDKISNATYFIFSDDIQWCKNNLKFIENKIFIEKSKNALEDLELMKNCKHNIIANSTFSWWGAWLNPNPEKIILGPKKWFLDDVLENHAKDLVPSSWIRI
jgi:hypothetical protein